MEVKLAVDFSKLQYVDVVVNKLAPEQAGLEAQEKKDEQNDPYKFFEVFYTGIYAGVFIKKYHPVQPVFALPVHYVYPVAAI